MHTIPLQPLGTLLDSHGRLLVKLEQVPTHQLMYATWYGNLTSREVITGAQGYLTYESVLHYPLLLNDKSHATGDWSEAMSWLEYEWLPDATGEGLRAIAYVFSPDMHNQLASIQFFERVKQYLPIQLFHDVPTAWQWLRLQYRSQHGPIPL
ncbi:MULTISPECIES: hypothetical protein [Hymenobacter]|uniref:SpoIIAA-like n=1 Tax=Hymenobacter mucosus TaxID=1411120 RepID=A0A238YMQ6_9BACT|nr:MULTISPECIES: hypothetical protein [Hymenobacter]SNR71893.1 hypothetical protein SAMN06269173_105346 [Hymenobacter mucosus]